MKKFIILLLPLVLAGCVSGGFRVTKKAPEEFTFTATFLHKRDRSPVIGKKVEIFSWYQPLLNMLSYRELGEVVTDKEGRIEFKTKELELRIKLEGAFFNHYGSEPFDARQHTTFLFTESNRPSYLDSIEIDKIEPVAGGDATR